MEEINYDGDPTQFDPLIEDGYEFSIQAVISRGWELFKGYPVGFVLYFLVYAIISGGISAAGGDSDGGGLIASLISAVASYLLSAGFYIVADRIAHGEKVEFSNFFDGFKYWKQLALGAMVVTFLIIIGFVCLIIPGIYLAVAYGFTIPLIVLARFEFWPAMETSRKVISKNWFQFFGLVIMIILINMLGLMALGIGLFVTAPLSAVIFYAAYEEVILKYLEKGGFDDQIEEIGQDEWEEGAE